MGLLLLLVAIRHLRTQSKHPPEDFVAFEPSKESPLPWDKPLDPYTITQDPIQLGNRENLPAFGSRNPYRNSIQAIEHTNGYNGGTGYGSHPSLLAPRAF